MCSIQVQRYPFQVQRYPFPSVCAVFKCSVTHSHQCVQYSSAALPIPISVCSIQVQRYPFQVQRYPFPSVCAVFKCSVTHSKCSVTHSHQCVQYSSAALPIPISVCSIQVQRYPFPSVCAVFKCSVTHSKCSVTHSKCSVTHSHQCVQYSRVSRQWYGCQSLGCLTCVQMLMYAIAHGDCTNTVRESALEADSPRKLLSNRGLEPAAVLRLAFQSDALPTELSPPDASICGKILWYALCWFAFHIPKSLIVSSQSPRADAEQRTRLVRLHQVTTADSTQSAHSYGSLGIRTIYSLS